MSTHQFDEKPWNERLADSLVGLSEAQKPFLDRHWQSNGFPTKVTFNCVDETPFPSDDLYTIFEDARHSGRFGNAEYFASLTAALNPVRGVLRDHPVIARALGRRFDCDEVQVGILNSVSLTSLSQMIVGQMMQNRAATKQGFMKTASGLNSLLLASTTDAKQTPTKALNVGMDIALFFGVRVNCEIDLGEGYSLVPLKQLDDYVDSEWLREVAPEHVEWRRTEGVFAIVHRFYWQPQIRNNHAFAERAYKAPPPLFHRWAEEFSNLLAVSLGTRTSWIMTLEGCISRVASDLLGQHHGPNSPRKGRSISHLYSVFTEFKEADGAQIQEAQLLFSRRGETAYAELAPVVYRLAEAYSRDGRFAAQDRILDIAIVFERLFKPANRQISKVLQHEIAELLGYNAEEKDRIKAEVKHLYDVRSAIIHGPSDTRKKQLLREVEKVWKAGAGIARAALIKKLA